MRADRFHCLERGWKGTHYSIKRPRVNGALSNVSEAKFSVSSSVFSFLSLSLFPPGLIYLLAILSAVLFDSFWQSKAKLSGQLPDPRWFDDSVRAEFERVSIISDLEQGQKGLAAFDLPFRSSYPRENRPSRSVARLDPPPPLPSKNCNCKRFTAGKERPGRDVVSKRISRELFLLDNKEFVPTLEPIYARYDSGSGIRQVSLEKVRRDRWRMFVVIERRSKVLEEPSSLPLPLLFLKRYYVPINFQIPCRIDVS